MADLLVLNPECDICSGGRSSPRGRPYRTGPERIQTQPAESGVNWHRIEVFDLATTRHCRWSFLLYLHGRLEVTPAQRLFFDLDEADYPLPDCKPDSLQRELPASVKAVHAPWHMTHILGVQDQPPDIPGSRSEDGGANVRFEPNMLRVGGFLVWRDDVINITGTCQLPIVHIAVKRSPE